MRRVRLAGEKTFVDYSRKRPSIFKPKTGEGIAVELFVAVLGASNYTFAEATRTSGRWTAPANDNHDGKKMAIRCSATFITTTEWPREPLRFQRMDQVATKGSQESPMPHGFKEAHEF